MLHPFFPSPPQLRALESTSRRLLIRHANKTGGTEVWARWMAEELTGHSEWRTVRRVVGPRRGICVAPSWRSIRDDVSPAILRHLPADVIAIPYDADTYGTTGGWRNGTISLRAGGARLLFIVEQGQQANKAGFPADFVGINEPPTPRTYSETIRALTATGGPLCLNACMVGRDLRWLRRQVEGDVTEGVSGEPGWDQVVIPYELANVPWSSQEDVDARIASVLPDEYAQRIGAAWEGQGVAQIITGYGDSCVTTAMPVTEQTIVAYVDWGDGVRCYVGMGCYDGRSTMALDEERAGDGTVLEVAQAMRRMTARSGMGISDLDRVVGDVNKAGLGYAARMNDLLSGELGRGVETYKRKGPGSVRYWARLLNAACKGGKFKTHPRCKLLHNGLLHWSGTDDGPDHDHKHPIDGIHYGLIEGIEASMSPRQLEILRVL